MQAYVELLLLSDDGDKQNILDRLVKLEPTNWEHYVLYGNWYKGRGESTGKIKSIKVVKKYSEAISDRCFQYTLLIDNSLRLFKDKNNYLTLS